MENLPREDFPCERCGAEESDNLSEEHGWVCDECIDTIEWEMNHGEAA